jgi:rSAM/selenodomain-associated transferase 1
VSDLLLVFLKWPEPGLTKTRLIPALGPETASSLSRLLAEEAVLATRPEDDEYGRLLCFSPAGAEAKVREWLPGEALWPQPEGDLGHRMAAAFAEGFRGGADRVAVIGTDIPSLSRVVVGQAFHALDDADLVLGPARDGGYYLMALRHAQPKLFTEIAWSTSDVLTVTRERATALGLRTQLLEPMHDLDRLEDLATGWALLEPILAREPGVRDAVARALAGSTGGGRFGAQ